jgi:hypothetical protein
VDYDHSLLRGVYESAEPELRQRIIAQARAAGRLEWVPALVDEAASNGRLDDAGLLAAVARWPNRSRALFYFLAGRWDEYQAVDYDHSLLRGIYESAEPELRQRIIAQARAAGRLEWVPALVDEAASSGRLNDAELLAAVASWPNQSRALFYFLAGRWDEYQAVDYFHSLLRGVYESAEPELRQRIIAQARTAGRLEWVRLEWVPALVDEAASNGRLNDTRLLAAVASWPNRSRALFYFLAGRWERPADECPGSLAAVASPAVAESVAGAVLFPGRPVGRVPGRGL